MVTGNIHIKKYTKIFDKLQTLFIYSSTQLTIYLEGEGELFDTYKYEMQKYVLLA